MFFAGANSYATSITVTQNGDWGNSDTWGGMGPPGCFDSIIIPAGLQVTITNTVDLTGCPPVQVFVDGSLIFQNGKKLDLPNGSVVWVSSTGYIDVGSGGGSSTYITIDGDQYWNAADGPLTGPAVLCQACALPIELITFTATLTSEGTVALHWETASEEQNDYFWVQRSLDGLTWENIAWVDGAGNSSALILYDETDRYPVLGLAYYRLKQVDMNGAFSVSDIRVVSNGNFFTNQDLLLISNTNECQHNIVVYFSEPLDGPVELMLVGVNGAVLYSEDLFLDSEKWAVIELDRPLAAGIYVVKASAFIERTFLQ